MYFNQQNFKNLEHINKSLCSGNQNPVWKISADVSDYAATKGVVIIHLSIPTLEIN